MKITQQEIDDWGNDYEKNRHDSLDFLLMDSDQKPLCALEAKKEIVKKFYTYHFLSQDIKN